MNYAQAFQHLRTALQPLYDAGEAAVIAKRFLSDVTGLEYSSGLARGIAPLAEEVIQRIASGSQELVIGKPLQYVLGWEDFLRRRFTVNEAVLIPRPETEELVQWVLEECGEARRILDVGTGSGCIAVSMALALPDAQVWAVDVSAEALKVAWDNAFSLGAEVEFLEMNALRATAWQALPELDVIVSNPPYIPAGEGDKLHPNVRDWEPNTALFVPDDDAVIFYRALAAMGWEKLQAGGRIYCEIQSDKVEETEAVFAQAGYEVEQREDWFGAIRMLRATLLPSW